MTRRTTIELDEDLVARAKKALGARTTRGAVEEALLRAVESAEQAHARRASAQREYLESLQSHIDVDVLKSDEMWR